jgi:hypothetical protein
VVRARQPYGMRARHAILKCFNLLFYQNDFLFGTCLGRFTNGGIRVVSDPGSLIVWNRENGKHGYRNGCVLLHAV